MRSISWLLMVFTIVSLRCEAALSQGDDSPVGMIVQSEGSVVIQRGGADRKAQLADLIFPKDRLTAVSGEASFLFCPSSSRVPLTPGTSLEITAEEFRVVHGDVPETSSVRRCSLPQVALGSESMERLGAILVRKAGLPELALYLGGPVSSSRPAFSWQEHEGAGSYRLTLLSEEGAVLWEAESSESRLDYPAGRDPLAAGVYEWRLEALSNERPVAQAATRFEVRAEESPWQGDPGSPGEILLAAVEYENAGYFAEAAGLYRSLRNTNEGDERLTSRLAWLYLQAGLTRAAQLEKDRLENSGE